ncbi:MAG: signal recognition particle-docking protein FtsY [Thermoguttaceae bacterium]|nr:signal recognition particle-docking protein FtsY [Thermoguttaceae bacterium]
MGFFGKIKSGLKQGLAKTVSILNTDVRDLFKTEGRLVDDAFCDELFEVLVKTDMGVSTAQEAADRVKKDFRGRVVERDAIIEAVKAKLKTLMAQDNAPLRFAESGPTIWLVCGVNGCGKTTSIAKLGKLFSSQGKKVVLGAADTFRAAAVDQLKIWADRLGLDLVVGPPRSDPASVAHKAAARAIETGADLCIIDTAGRLQTNRNLMNELEKIKRVVQKMVPDAPHESILVLDATMGQNGLSQARAFTESAACSGIFLTKLDGTARGGAVAAIRKEVGLPVRYVGLGESADDIVAFNPDEFVDAMFENLD